MRALTLLAVTLAGLAGCEGVSHDPLGAGHGSSNEPTAGADSGGEGGAGGGNGGTVGATGGSNGATGGTFGGEGGSNGATGGMVGGEGGANGATGGAPGGEGGSNGATGGTFGGEGGANGATGGAPGGEGGALGGESGVGAGGIGGAAGDTAGEAGSGGRAPVFRRCSPGKPFGAPKRSGIPNGCTQLRLNPDETVGYYGCRNTGAYQVIVATRPDRNALFGEGTIVHEDPDDNDYYSPTVTADGLLLFFENYPGSSSSRIYWSVWDPKLGAFGPIEPALGLGPADANYDDYAPYVVPSGAAVYFHSARVHPFEEVYRAAWDGDSFSEPEHIALQGSRGYAVVSPDELTLYYTRNVSNGSLGADIWQVTRATTSESFASIEPTLVQGPNEGSYNDLASFISEDGCRLYFDRNFPAPDTNSYVVERVPDLE